MGKEKKQQQDFYSLWDKWGKTDTDLEKKKKMAKLSNLFNFFLSKNWNSEANSYIFFESIYFNNLLLFICNYFTEYGTRGRVEEWIVKMDGIVMPPPWNLSIF